MSLHISHVIGALGTAVGKVYTYFVTSYQFLLRFHVLTLFASMRVGVFAFFLFFCVLRLDSPVGVT